MSVSALFGTALPFQTSPSLTATTTKPFPMLNLQFTPTFPTIECSSRPQKKATAHHRKTRPKKSQPWDIKRGPAVYPPLPALPAEWSFAPKDEDEDEDVAEETPDAVLETAVA